MNLNVGDIPSWILALLIGIGIFGAISRGFLEPTYNIGGNVFPMLSIGWVLVIGALFLGATYFIFDIRNKL